MLVVRIMPFFRLHNWKTRQIIMNWKTYDGDWLIQSRPWRTSIFLVVPKPITQSTEPVEDTLKTGLSRWRPSKPFLVSSINSRTVYSFSNWRKFIIVVSHTSDLILLPFAQDLKRFTSYEGEKSKRANSFILTYQRFKKFIENIHNILITGSRSRNQLFT